MTDATIADSSSAPDVGSTEVTVGSAESSAAPTETSDAQTSSQENVPYDRFQEVIQQKNSYKSEIDALKEQLHEYQSNIEPKKSEEQIVQDSIEEQIDPINDPKAFRESLKKELYEEINQEIAKKEAINNASLEIDKQYQEIRDKYGEINEEEIGNFAIDMGIRNEDGSYNLIKSYEILQKINGAREEGGKEVMKSVQRGQTAPVSNSSTTKEVGLPVVSQSKLRNMTWDALFSKVVKQ